MPTKEMVGIERGIPIPASRRGQHHKLYPFAELKIGDSILINAKSRQAIYYYQYRYAPSFKFTVRREGDKYRVWRTA